MPGGDGTGPMGMGPMTGRRTGFCARYPNPGYANSCTQYVIRGRGYRRRYFRYGYGNWNYPPYSVDFEPIQPVDEKKYLISQAELLEKELKDIKARLEKIDKEI